MSDIKQRLQNWVEASADPVPADEAIRRAEKDSPRRTRGWQSTLLPATAGAAVILLLIGLPIIILDPFGADSTATPTTQSTPTTASTVPGWEGKAISTVRAEADELGIRLDEEAVVLDDATPGKVIRQEPAPGQPLPDDGIVVVGVATAPEDDPTPTTQSTEGSICALPETAPQAGERYVSVFYGCGGAPDEKAQPVLRAIPEDSEDLVAAAYQALLAGPTQAELEEGIVSAFADDLSETLASVSYDSGVVRVDLEPGFAELTLKDSDLVALFATGFQFETTARVEITVGGSCESFSDRFGMACDVEADSWWHDGVARDLILGWPRVVARPASVTGDCQVPENEPASGEMAITVLFSCRSGADTIIDLVPTTRIVPAFETVRPLALLEELVKGPNGTERSNGMDGTFFSERTAHMVDSVEIEGSRLIVDFQPFVRSPAISNISTSTGGTVFNTLLNANLFQFPEIDEIEYRVDGSCDAYWANFEAECSIQTRAGHERALEELS